MPRHLLGVRGTVPPFLLGPRCLVVTGQLQVPCPYLRPWGHTWWPQNNFILQKVPDASSSLGPSLSPKPRGGGGEQMKIPLDHQGPLGCLAGSLARALHNLQSVPAFTFPSHCTLAIRKRTQLDYCFCPLWKCHFLGVRAMSVP